MHTETLERNTTSRSQTGEGKPLSQLLKEATEKIHHEVEHGATITRGVVANVSALPEDSPERIAYLENYKQFLYAAYGYERATLDRVEEFDSTSDELKATNYPRENGDPCELIHEDLVVLGDTRVLKTMPGLPDIESLAQLAGIEYVRRGSRNGNAYIAHTVRQNLGFAAGSGASFLNMDGGLTRPHWEQVKNWLDSLVLTPIDVQNAVDSAIIAFRAVGDWHKSLS